MTQHIDFRPHSSKQTDYTLELKGGLFSFNGRICTSSPDLDRYMAIINGSKRLIRHFKNEGRAEMLILDEPEPTPVVFTQETDELNSYTNQ